MHHAKILNDFALVSVFVRINPAIYTHVNMSIIIYMRIR